MAGLYIHIPFCKQKCSYCDFHFSTRFGVYRTELLGAMAKELASRAGEMGQQEIESVYFGGGTPGILEAEEIALLLNQITKHYHLASNPEITLEANPDDVNPEKVRNWKELGVNRLSMGIQSFNDADLKWMNRAHDARMAERSLKQLQDGGFTNINADLIYGLPGQTTTAWLQNLHQLLALQIPHLSAYCLTIEGGTAIKRWIDQGRIQAATEELQIEHFLAMKEVLDHKGWSHYEISNFALPDYHSRHNSAYWEGKAYLGIGPSAHSYSGNTRRWNVANNHKYLRAFRTGQVFHQQEELSEIDRFNEKILTGLRTSKGIDLLELSTIHSLPVTFSREIERFHENAWIEETDRKIRLSTEGMLQADHIASRLFIVP